MRTRFSAKCGDSEDPPRLVFGVEFVDLGALAPVSRDEDVRAR